MSSEKISIIGGGLSGTLLAVYLARRGFQVQLFEKRPDMRFNRISAGRSINLALSVRGVKALERVGLADEVLADGIPMYGRMIHHLDGKLSFQPYGKEGQAIYSVSRGRLNTRLLELASEYPNIQMYFEHRCTDVDIPKGLASFEDAKGNPHVYQADRIIGCDGAFAATRGSMLFGDRFNYSQNYLTHGYKELSIPPAEGGNFQMEKNALHIWPRGSFMMIALPNPAGDFTNTLFLPFEGDPGFDDLKTNHDVLNFFKQQFPDAVPMMPSLLNDFSENPTSSLVTVRCFPWIWHDKMALLGDAAHAIVPFYGQGMNCSFEDVAVMDDCIEADFPDWENVFKAYQSKRKVNADAVADLALQNFVEMRDLVGDADFLKKKEVEHSLTELYADVFKSQYELVTFSHYPYSVALKQGETNDKILTELIAEKTDLNHREKVLAVINRFDPEAKVRYATKA